MTPVVDYTFVPTADRPGEGVLVIGGTYYLLKRIPTDFGRHAFELKKYTHLTRNRVRVEEVYHIHMGKDSWCDCMGHTAHSHCKHYSTLSDMVKKGRI